MGITDYLSRSLNLTGPEDKSLSEEITICQINFLNDWKNSNLARAIWSESADQRLPICQKLPVQNHRTFGATELAKPENGVNIFEPIKTLELVKRTKEKLLTERNQGQSKTNKRARIPTSINSIDSFLPKFGILKQNSKSYGNYSNQSGSNSRNFNQPRLQNCQRKETMSSQDSDGETSQIGELTKARANVILAELDEVRQTGKVIMSEGSIKPHRLPRKEKRKEVKLQDSLVDNYN